MSPGVLLIAVVVGAYLAAHVASEWLARRHLIVSGAEYLLLGVLLGPEVSGLIRADTMDRFAPLLTLAFGWVGALVGAQFHIPDLWRLPIAPFRVALTQALVAGTLTAGAMGALFVLALGLGPGEVTGPALALGAIAVSSAPAGIAVVSQKLGDRGPLVRQLHITTAVDAMFAIVAFGLLLPGGSHPLGGAVPAVLSATVGLVGGALFHLFVGNEKDVDRLFIALAGALILTSGAAAYLRISPLLPSFLVGLVLINTSPSGARIRGVLTQVERPLYFVLLVFAGTAWQSGGTLWWLITFAFIAARILGKVGGARLAAHVHGALPTLGPRWGWGLVGHGGLAVAIALNFRMYDASALAGIAFTATLVSLIVTDVFSARVVGVLITSASHPPMAADERRGDGGSA